MSTTISSPGTLTGTYQLDPTHSRLGFVARHAMVTKVRGSFNEFSGSGHLDPDDLVGSRFEVTVDVASVDTRNADRDGHLRSNDFFDLEQYPEITFVTTGIDQVDTSTYAVTGDLTIKGTTKSVTFDLVHEGAAVDPYGNFRVGFEGSTIINRKDFGVAFNAPLEAGGVLVGEKVTLELEVSAIRTDA